MTTFLFIVGVFILLYSLSDWPRDYAQVKREREQRERLAKGPPPSES